MLSVPFSLSPRRRATAVFYLDEKVSSTHWWDDATAFLFEIGELFEEIYERVITLQRCDGLGCQHDECQDDIEFAVHCWQTRTDLDSFRKTVTVVQDRFRFTLQWKEANGAEHQLSIAISYGAPHAQD